MHKYVGCAVGDSVGTSVGLVVGDSVGDTVGLVVGESVGDTVGVVVGDIVGASVHPISEYGSPTYDASLHAQVESFVASPSVYIVPGPQLVTRS